MAQPSSDKSGEPSEELFHEGFDSEAIRMRDLLTETIGQFSTDESKTTAEKFVVQTSPVDLMANIVVT